MRQTLKKKLSEDIIHRYALFGRQEDGHMNPVIDSYVPKIIAMKLKGQENGVRLALNNLPSTKYAISEYFANSTETRQLPFKYMSEILGFKQVDIKKLLNKVKSKNHRMIMIGFGGTNANVWWWLSKMCEWTGIINVFEEIAVVDDDDIELHNILRFPFDLSTMNGSNGSTKKIHMFNNHAQLTKNYSKKNSRFPCQVSTCVSSIFIGSEVDINERSDLLEHEGHPQRAYKINDNTFIFGAPTLETRNKLADTKFIAATHGDDHCSMTICPEVDTGLLIESYGMIRLNTFFMNHIRMSIALLEFLASDDENKWTEKNNRIFEYDFKKAVDEGLMHKTEKTIFFDTNHDGRFEEI